MLRHRQLHIPPLTSPFVHIADIDKAVIVVTTPDSRMTSTESPIPACPTTHDKRRNNITPHMLSRHRTYNQTQTFYLANK